MNDNINDLNAGILERDEKGRISKKVLSSEEAARLGSIPKGVKEAEKLARKMLKDRGMDYDSADEGIKSLAKIAVSGRSGAVPAQKYLDTITGHFQQTTTQITSSVRYLKKGEKCPLCGNIHYRPTQDEVNDMRALYRLMTRVYKDLDVEEFPNLPSGAPGIAPGAGPKKTK